MKSKEEIKNWLIENATDKYGNIDLSDINFGKKDILLIKIKANVIYNSYQEANEIKNNSQKASEIDNTEQEAVQEIINIFQEAKEISNGFQKAITIFNNEQEAAEIKRTITESNE